MARRPGRVERRGRADRPSSEPPSGRALDIETNAKNSTMPRDASAIFQAQAGTYDELERLSALETLKGLRSPEAVTLGDLVGYLDSRGLWTQFAKITLGDLRDAFAPPPAEAEANGRRKKRRILEDELEDAYAEKAEKEGKAKAEPEADGIDSEEFARLVMPFVEGNGDVTLDDIEEYSRLDRKVLRRHLTALVKEGRLERIGVGRHAVYSSAL
jgi:hypothetical protein